MSMAHAVLWLDHHHAHLQQFDHTQVQFSAIKDHPVETARHQSDVRTEHEYFGAVCDAIGGSMTVLVAGSGRALDDFKHYVGKHRPELVPSIAGWETVDHPSDGELVAMAKKFFIAHDRMQREPVHR